MTFEPSSVAVPHGGIMDIGREQSRTHHTACWSFGSTSLVTLVSSFSPEGVLTWTDPPPHSSTSVLDLLIN